ncbi:MAG TPA: hypothetical protein PLP30_07005 [Clostridia bacterium]|nr:hypothetical protein [Clostridia bacterium]HRX41399.1 hypothetical protein [Clostridia bacterium]
MTEYSIFEIINEVYGYEIIGADALEKLRASRDVLLSEFGIESIYEFLSYDITEFSDARKSIHVRRFFQGFKEIFDLKAFNFEAFHKIQAGCLYTALTSGIMRGYGSYDYSGFVNEVLQTVRTGGEGRAGMTPVEMLGEITGQFELFSRISLGIYSLQIFTKYGIGMDKLNLGPLVQSHKLFIKVLKSIESGADATGDIKRILKLRIPSDEKINEMVEEYVEYAVSGVMEEGIPISRSKAVRELTDSLDEVRTLAAKAFAPLYIDLDGLRKFQDSIRDKLDIYTRSMESSDISILFITLLEKLISDFGNLGYYEDVFFIRHLNSLFIGKVREVFNAQMEEEGNEIREQCIKIIENAIEGYKIHDLDSVLNALSLHSEDFSRQYSLADEEIEGILSELKTYLRQQLETVYDIRRNLKENLSDILRPEILEDEASKILNNAIFNFADIRNFLLEEE